MEADYGDTWGDKLRHSHEGGPLPNARKLSTLLHGQHEKGEGHSQPLSEQYSQVLMNWGQIMADEVSYTGGNFPGVGGLEPEPCCTKGKARTNPMCGPVPISKEDPFYSKYRKDIDCLNFLRSESCPTCDVDNPDRQREVINMRTSWIDGSGLYGSDKDGVDSHRVYKCGKSCKTPFMRFASRLHARLAHRYNTNTHNQKKTRYRQIKILKSGRKKGNFSLFRIF